MYKKNLETSWFRTGIFIDTNRAFMVKTQSSYSDLGTGGVGLSAYGLPVVFNCTGIVLLERKFRGTG